MTSATAHSKPNNGIESARSLVHRSAGRIKWPGAVGTLVGLMLGMAIGYYYLADGAGWAVSSKDLANPRYFPKESAEFPSREVIEKTIDQAQATLETDPTNLNALVASGVAYYTLGREHAVEALNRLESARDYGSIDPRVPFYLARLYDTVNLKQFAANEYERYLRNNPDHQQALLEAARVYFELSFYEQSLKLYERLISLDEEKKENPSVIENMGITYLKMKDWEKARALLEKLRDLKKGYSSESFYFLGEAYRNLGRYSEALPLYDEAITTIGDETKKLLVLEAKLACLVNSSVPETGPIRTLAEQILDMEPKHKEARSALKKFREKKKK